MENNSLKEFIKSIKKVSEKRESKNLKSNGVKQAFFYYRKNRKKEKKYVLNSIQYYEILRRIHEEIILDLLKGNKINLPLRMGELQIELSETFVGIKDNKLITNRNVDWQKTLELWQEDEESKENKSLVRYENKYNPKIKYIKKKAFYINKSYYRFTPHRTFMYRLKDATPHLRITKTYHNRKEK